jgi:non-ribosomal peptide synthetase component E (peptide arylation enzyme)
VAECAIAPTPDPVLGEAICACVVPAVEQPPSLADLRSDLAVRLARHKLPDELCLLESLPRSRMGKLDRKALSAIVLGGDRPRERLRPPSPALSSGSQ